ncbi:PilZ domain-containing protein, partial [Virgibacillus sp. W0430]|uniref:PilZ domain-containing protein n=1 Tax=Virgibacillus sp. W0430 TaxID=3391580 RepID=UPI003F469FB0
YYRAKVLDNINCTITFLDFGTHKLNSLIKKSVVGNIHDISVGGLRFSCTIDLPVQYHVVTLIYFEIFEETFHVKCTLIRKESKINRNVFNYGVKFIELDSKDEKRLAAIVNSLELATHKVM